MVRRWSYLNRVNFSLFTNNKSNLKPVLNILKITTFKATTYYWEELYFQNITLIKRRSYLRRKHINSFILYQNLLTLWSNDYIFFRKYSRSILVYNLHKYNFLLQSIFMAKSLDVSNFLGFEELKVTFFSKRLLTFCSYRSLVLIPFILLYKGPYLYASSLIDYSNHLSTNHFLKDEPIYPYVGNSIFYAPIKKGIGNPINYLSSVINNLFSAQLIKYYQLVILLLYSLLILFLRRSRVTSGASRSITKLTSNWFFKKRYNQLTWTKKSTAGRGLNGRVLIRSKSSILKKLRFPKINYFFRSRDILLISTFHLIPFQNKLVSLCFLSSGSVTYLQSTNLFKNFSLISTPSFSLKTLRKEYITPILSTLLRVKTLSKVSLLELYPGSGAQYARSAGVSGRLVKANLSNHTALITLPSGVRKSFSLYSIVTLGSVSLKNKRLVTNTKSGFWRTYGLKSKTRGVAMNPIDHPHGGRTKAIKNPRTPWGKPTKLK